MDATSLEPADGKRAVNMSPIDSEWETGPNLDPPGWLHWKKSIFWYACKHHRAEIVVMVSAMVLLIIGVLKWDVLSPPMHSHNAIGMATEIIQNIRSVLFSPTNSTVISSVSPPHWAEWWFRMQSFLGVGTLLVALFVWYGKIREDWRNDLPKRLSVFFFYGSKPVIVCRYVWLAGEDELRTWGQQVAKQAAGNQNLDFSPDVEARKPSLAVEKNGEICKHYAVRFVLTRMPSSQPDSRVCRYQNFAADDKSVRDIPSDEVAKLSTVADWEMTANNSSETMIYKEPLKTSKVRRLVAYVSGRVQETEYIAKVTDFAEMLGLKGGVENLDDGRVKIVVEGDEDKLKWFEEAINIKNSLIQVASIEREYSEPRGDFSRFYEIVDKADKDSRQDIVAVHLMNLIGAVNDLNENLGRKMDTMIELQIETIELQKEGLNSSKNLLEEVRKSRKDII
jgi:acylphosphatase